MFRPVASGAAFLAFGFSTLHLIGWGAACLFRLEVIPISTAFVIGAAGLGAMLGGWLGFLDYVAGRQ
jgi:hypothetical protein